MVTFQEGCTVEQNSNVTDWQQDEDGYATVDQIESKLIVLTFTLGQSMSNVSSLVSDARM